MKLLLAYAGSVLLSVSQSTLCKFGGKNSSPAVFNINKACSAAIMFFIVGLFTNMFPINTPTLIYGLIYGVFFCISMLAGLKAFVLGPLAITSMLISFSLLIPFAYGIIIGEEITLYGYAGLALLLASFVLINLSKNDKKEGKKVSLKWLLLTVITLCSDGFGAVVRKLHQDAFPNQYKIEIMFVALTTAGIFFTFLFFVSGEFKKEKRIINPWGMLAGLANGGSSYFSLYLVAMEDISVQAPVLAALTSIAALCSGRFLFKEKLKPAQLAGFGLGVASIVLLKL